MAAAASVIAEMFNPGNKAYLYTFIFDSDCQRIFIFLSLAAASVG